jgi:hypothetical protein
LSSEQLPTFVLTVRQPWAWAIIYAGKDIENRGWKPRRPCRVLIHAGKLLETDTVTMLRRSRELREAGIRVPRQFTGGQIIGCVEVLTWDRDSDSPWAVPGQWHWHLTSPAVALPPIEYRGKPAFQRPPPGWQRSFPQLEVS